jgi:hypothetical protein
MEVCRRCQPVDLAGWYRGISVVDVPDHITGDGAYQDVPVTLALTDIGYDFIGQARVFFAGSPCDFISMLIFLVRMSMTSLIGAISPPVSSLQFGKGRAAYCPDAAEQPQQQPVMEDDDPVVFVYWTSNSTNAYFRSSFAAARAARVFSTIFRRSAPVRTDRAPVSVSRCCSARVLSSITLSRLITWGGRVQPAAIADITIAAAARRERAPGQMPLQRDCAAPVIFIRLKNSGRHERLSVPE